MNLAEPRSYIVWTSNKEEEEDGEERICHLCSKRGVTLTLFQLFDAGKYEFDSHRY